VKRFRGGLVFKAHRLCVSLNSRLESHKERERDGLHLPQALPKGPPRFKNGETGGFPYQTRGLSCHERGSCSHKTELLQPRRQALHPHPARQSDFLNKPMELLYRHLQRFRGGLVFKAHRRVYHSTLGLRVIKKKKHCTHTPHVKAIS